MWPTASAGDAENAACYARGNPSLVGAMYPTPTATTAYGTNSGGQNPGPARPSIERLLLEQQRFANDGAPWEPGIFGHLALNPAWVEHLMGFPPGWTDLPRWRPMTASQRSKFSALLCLTPVAWDALLAGGGRRAAGKSSTRGKRRASSPDPSPAPQLADPG